MCQLLVVFSLIDNLAVICAYFVKQTTLHRHKEDKVSCIVLICCMHMFEAETIE